MGDWGVKAGGIGFGEMRRRHSRFGLLSSPRYEAGFFSKRHSHRARLELRFPDRGKVGFDDRLARLRWSLQCSKALVRVDGKSMAESAGMISIAYLYFEAKDQRSSTRANYVRRCLSAHTTTGFCVG